MFQPIWQSSSCLVVRKPAGLPTQAPPPHPSLESRLRAHFAATATAPSSDYLALPHRLDRPVSGLILVARTKRAARLLGQQFESRKVSKRYLAWVEGHVEIDPTALTWHDRLRKLPGQPRGEIVDLDVDDPQPTTAAVPDSQRENGSQRDGRVSTAITEVRVVRQQGQRTLLELHPLTGRMHQLRIQSAYRGHPILGDRLYGATTQWRSAMEIEMELSGPAASDSPITSIALHAWQLGFHDPANGKWVEVTDTPDWPAGFELADQPSGTRDSGRSPT